MGMVFGKITVETAKYDVVKQAPEYEIRRYAPSVIAQVTYDPSEFKNDKDGGFTILANYIGALGNPQNIKPEKIAMTAPVITKEDNKRGESVSESIAMTAPVITKEDSERGESVSESIAMTAPVITKEGDKRGESVSESIAMTAPVITKEDNKRGECVSESIITNEKGKLVTMLFVLPSKYKKAEEAPRPVDERVEIKEEGVRVYGVVKFSGVATDEVVAEKVKKLKEWLARDGVKVVGEYLLGRYNPPWTIPGFRTNEVMIPVEFDE